MKRVLLSRNGLGPDLLRDNLISKPSGRELPLKGNDILYGLHPVKMALKSNNREIFSLYTSSKVDNEILQRADERKVKIEMVDRKLIERSIPRWQWNPHQNILLDCNKLPCQRISRDEHVEAFKELK